MAGKRVTMKDIADSLGVSVNTVSRALANKPDTSEQMREKVHLLAKELGYIPNSLARSLVSGSSSTIGMVITNPSNPLYSTMITGATTTAHESGLSVVLAISGEDEATERRAIESLIQSAVDGVVGVPVQTASDHWKRLPELGIPLTFVNRHLEHLGFQTDFVGCDHQSGAAASIDHVLSCGASTIWALEEDLDNSTVRGRMRAYELAALPSEELQILRVPSRRHEALIMTWEGEEAYTLMTENLAGAVTVPDAIVCANDFFALGAIRALADRGLRVPEDVLVVGTGDHPYAGFTSPPLTSVALPGQELGSLAVEMVTNRKANPDAPFRHTVLETDLVVRESSSRPKSAGSS